MTPRILFIGASGNIGASVLEALVKEHPELPVDALVRSQEDSTVLKETYPNTVKPVLGSLEDLSLLEEKASQASIVINCAPDVPHSKPLASLLTSLSSASASASARQQLPRFYIHTSGAARIWDAPDGFVAGRIWDDIADFDALPRSATHAATDAQVLSSASAVLHTAVISPCFVVGRSPSRSHSAPIVFPYLLDAINKVGGGFVAGEGTNVTAFVDTGVLAEVYVKLAEDAVRVIRGEKAVDGEVWGPRGFYFVSSLEVSFREFVQDFIVPSLSRCGGEGMVRNDGVKEMTQEEVVSMVMGNLGGMEALWSRHIAEGFGTAMRIRGSRAKKYLGLDAGKGLPGLDDAVKATLRGMAV